MVYCIHNELHENLIDFRGVVLVYNGILLELIIYHYLFLETEEYKYFNINKKSIILIARL